MGLYDIALIADAPDEASMTAFGLGLGALATFGRKRCGPSTPRHRSTAVLGRLE